MFGCDTYDYQVIPLQEEGHSHQNQSKVDVNETPPVEMGGGESAEATLSAGPCMDLKQVIAPDVLERQEKSKQEIERGGAGACGGGSPVAWNGKRGGLEPLAHLTVSGRISPVITSPHVLVSFRTLTRTRARAL